MVASKPLHFANPKVNWFEMLWDNLLAKKIEGSHKSHHLAKTLAASFPHKFGDQLRNLNICADIGPPGSLPWAFSWAKHVPLGRIVFPERSSDQAACRSEDKYYHIIIISISCVPCTILFIHECKHIKVSGWPNFCVRVGRRIWDSDVRVLFKVCLHLRGTCMWFISCLSKDEGRLGLKQKQ